MESREDVLENGLNGKPASAKQTHECTQHKSISRNVQLLVQIRSDSLTNPAPMHVCDHRNLPVLVERRRPRQIFDTGGCWTSRVTVTIRN